MAIFRYVFVLNDTDVLDMEDEEKCDVIISTMQKELEKYCKKWVFQLERGKEKQRLHLQGRMSLRVKKRKIEAVKLFSYGTISLQPEGPDEEASDFYCCKEDETFMKGPWRDLDKPAYIPRQVREIVDLYPWQNSIIKIAKIWETRNVHVIANFIGGEGKTTLVTYMSVHGLGKALPFCNDYKDLMRMAYCVGYKPCYLIDMPRAINKERLYQLYSAIESIKGGYSYDERNTFRDRWNDCPNIFIFTNKIPDEDMLSKDRWVLWTVNSDKELVPYKGTVGARAVDPTVLYS